MKVRSNFSSNIQRLFCELSYNKTFTKEKLEIVFKVKKSHGSEIISILLDNNIIELTNNSKYKFKK